MKTTSNLKTHPALIHFFVLLFILCPLSFILVACNTTEPPPPPPVIDDEIKNSITIQEVWRDLNALQIKFDSSSIDSLSLFTYYLYVNGTETNVFTNLSGDTTFTHTNLVEGTEYSYRVKAYEETELRDTSKTVRISTLSPTSHEIEWTVDTLGVPGNFLNDIWGLDENNVWAVGGVNLPEGDAVLIKWDGTKWSPLPIPNGGFRGLYGFSANEIWCVGEISNRGYIAKWNGSVWEKDFGTNYFDSRGDTVYPLNAVWGSSPEDVWVVGDRGTIVHWDGVQWEKEQNILTERPLTDIWGTSSKDIYAVAFSLILDSKILHYDGEEWIDITNSLPQPAGNLRSMWIDKAQRGFVTGGWVLAFDNGSWKQINAGITAATFKVRGRDITDVILVGQESIVHHYNGTSWERYEELEDRNAFTELRSALVLEERIICVGKTSDGAKIIIGARK